MRDHNLPTIRRRSRRHHDRQRFRRRRRRGRRQDRPNVPREEGEAVSAPLQGEARRGRGRGAQRGGSERRESLAFVVQFSWAEGPWKHHSVVRLHVDGWRVGVGGI